jgi:hypothetical protein
MTALVIFALAVVLPLVMLAAIVWFIRIGIDKLETVTGTLSPLSQTTIAVVVVFGGLITVIIVWTLLVG